ncbi:hypothetical protein H311_00449 [Anncaliia algerae PRA109]|nr:hypothetical protein H311_00449 [Anncaliia algerae PRA109]
MKIPIADFNNNKLGGSGKIVQINENMLNNKCKSHRGLLPENKTDSSCIVEVSSKIQGAYATIIPNRKEITIIPTICNQVASNSMIRIDEHKSYFNLNNYSNFHKSIRRRYEFINVLNGVNIQSIELFNNCLKLEI